MRFITENVGANAGKVWTTLDMHGPLTFTNLLKNTRLSLNDLYAAIGWLARENKIQKTQRRAPWEERITNQPDHNGGEGHGRVQQGNQDRPPPESSRTYQEAAWDTDEHCQCRRSQRKSQGPAYNPINLRIHRENQANRRLKGLPEKVHQERDRICFQ